MKLGVLIIFLLLKIPLDGQKPMIITLEYQWEKPSIQNFYVSKIIDNRLIKDNIGYALIKQKEGTRAIEFESSFEDEIQRVCDKILPYNKVRRELHLRVNRLRVSSTSTFAVLQLSVEFLEKKDSSYISIGVFHQMVMGSGTDLVKKHQRNIRKGIRDCIEEFSNSPQQPIVDNLVNMDFSHGFDSSLTVGVYRSFDALKSNQPENSLGRILMRGRKEVQGVKKYVIKQGKKKKRVREYAYFDGKNLLLNSFVLGGSSFDFLRNKTLGPYLLYTDRYEDNNMGYYYMLGLLGAIIQAGSRRTRSSILNLRTGRILPVDDKLLLEISKGHNDLHSRYNRSNKTLEDLRILIQSVNDQIVETG